MGGSIGGLFGGGGGGSTTTSASSTRVHLPLAVKRTLLDNMARGS